MPRDGSIRELIRPRLSAGAGAGAEEVFVQSAIETSASAVSFHVRRRFRAYISAMRYRTLALGLAGLAPAVPAVVVGTAKTQMAALWSGGF